MITQYDPEVLCVPHPGGHGGDRTLPPALLLGDKACEDLLDQGGVIQAGVTDVAADPGANHDRGHPHPQGPKLRIVVYGRRLDMVVEPAMLVVDHDEKRVVPTLALV